LDATLDKERAFTSKLEKIAEAPATPVRRVSHHESSSSEMQTAADRDAQLVLLSKYTDEMIACHPRSEVLVGEVERADTHPPRDRRERHLAMSVM